MGGRRIYYSAYSDYWGEGWRAVMVGAPVDAQQGQAQGAAGQEVPCRCMPCGPTPSSFATLDRRRCRAQCEHRTAYARRCHWQCDGPADHGGFPHDCVLHAWYIPDKHPGLSLPCGRYRVVMRCPLCRAASTVVTRADEPPVQRRPPGPGRGDGALVGVLRAPAVRLGVPRHVELAEGCVLGLWPGFLGPLEPVLLAGPLGCGGLRG